MTAEDRAKSFLEEKGELHVTAKGDRPLEERPVKRLLSKAFQNLPVALLLAASVGSLVYDRVQDAQFAAGPTKIIYDQSIPLGDLPAASRMLSESSLDDQRLIAILDAPDHDGSRQIAEDEARLLEEAADYAAVSETRLMTGASDGGYPVGTDQYWRHSRSILPAPYDKGPVVSMIYLGDVEDTLSTLRKGILDARAVVERIERGDMDPADPMTSPEVSEIRAQWLADYQHLGSQSAPSATWEKDRLLDMAVSHELAHALLNHKAGLMNALYEMEERLIDQVDSLEGQEAERFAQQSRGRIDELAAQITFRHEIQADVVGALVAYKAYGDEARGMVEDWRDYRWFKRYYGDRGEEDHSHYTSSALQQVLDLDARGASFSSMTMEEVLAVGRSVTLEEGGGVEIDFSSAPPRIEREMSRMIHQREKMDRSYAADNDSPSLTPMA